MRVFLSTVILACTASGILPVATADSLSPELAAQKRLRELLPDKTEFRHTHYGRKLNMVSIPDASRHKVRLEQYQIFGTLVKLGTHAAIRVLAEYLSDNRLIYEPGSDYGSPTLAEEAARSLREIRRADKIPTGPDIEDVAGWRIWWSNNKTTYEAKPSEIRSPK